MKYNTIAPFINVLTSFLSQHAVLWLFKVEGQREERSLRHLCCCLRQNCISYSEFKITSGISLAAHYKKNQFRQITWAFSWDPEQHQPAFLLPQATSLAQPEYIDMSSALSCLLCVCSPGTGLDSTSQKGLGLASLDSGQNEEADNKGTSHVSKVLNKVGDNTE